LSVEAGSREEAVEKMKNLMDEDAVAAHMKDKHLNGPTMPISQVHAMIESNLQAA
jgi:hypothetical protein